MFFIKNDQSVLYFLCLKHMRDFNLEKSRPLISPNLETCQRISFANEREKQKRDIEGQGDEKGERTVEDRENFFATQKKFCTRERCFAG